MPQTTKSTLTFDAEYTYDNILLNELYAIPKLKPEMKIVHLNHTELDASYLRILQDRKHRDHRLNIANKAKKISL